MRRTYSAGFVLPAVLWGVILLALIAGNLLLLGRAGTVQAIAGETRARLMAAAQAGLARALHELDADRPGAPPERIAFAVEGIAVDVSISSESGRIDLNRAPASLLAAAFEHAGAESDAAALLAAAVLDWRDADHVEELGGAENRVYRLAGRPEHPRDAPFASVGELARVRGAETLDLVKVHDLLSIASPVGTVDSRAASGPVCAVLDGLGEACGVGTTGIGLLAPSHPSGDVRRLRISASDPVAGGLTIEALVRRSGDGSFQPIAVYNLAGAGNDRPAAGSPRPADRLEGT